MLVKEFLKEQHPQSIWVRINPLGSEDFIRDVEAVTASAPAGFVVPKPDGPQALNVIDAHLITRETQAGLAHGAIKLLPVATETPVAAMSLQDYRAKPPRLAAKTWGAEGSLRRAPAPRAIAMSSGEFLLTYRIVRSLCSDRGEGGRRARDRDAACRFPRHGGAHACRARGAARRLHRHARDPSRSGRTDQRTAFTPSQSDVAHAKRVVAAFATGAGVASLDGKMLDQRRISSRRGTCSRWTRR